MLPNHSTTESEEDPTELTPTVVLDTLQQDGWNFSSILSTTSVFEGEVKLIIEAGHTSTMQRENKRGPSPSWELNYPALSFLLNGQYYSDYENTLSLMGLPVMSDTA